LGNDSADYPRQHFKMRDSVSLRLTEMFWNGTGNVVVGSERNGAAADAVNAEGQIENWAQDRQKPDRDQPESRGARISFVEQGVN